MEILRKHFGSIDSTNTWAKQHAHELDHQKVTLVTAAVQTAGRGRFKRRWESPAGQNILATFCIFIEKHRMDIGNLPQVLALSTALILNELGFHPQLKWPNDVLITGKKVAGILCETTPLSDNFCVIIGIGVNINMPAEELIKIDRPATSLFAEDGVLRDIEEMIGLLQEQFMKDLEVFLEEGFHPFLSKYKTFMAYAKGDKIRFDDNRTIWTGAFEGIKDDGSLELELEPGIIKTFHAGEILF
jgi:BirA family biotin operon repressor/biotin-[acetyl-CoA-carboxylase] ligase